MLLAPKPGSWYQIFGSSAGLKGLQDLLLSDMGLVQDNGAEGLPPKAAKMLRFCAHLGLALADLEIAPHQHVTGVPGQVKAIQVIAYW